MNFTTLLLAALVATLGATVTMHPNDIGGGPSGAPSTAVARHAPIGSVGVDDSGGGPSGSPQATATVTRGPIGSVGVDDFGGGPVTAPYP